VENKERQIYKDNIYFLAKDLLGFKDLTTSFHYKHICKKLNEPRQKNIRLWLIPRGFFKTTILTVTRAVHLQMNNPSIRIAIISAVMANAKSMVVQIGNTYLTNERFRMLFPEYCPKKPLAPETKWTESEIHIPNRGGRPVMEGTFEAFGADSTLTSRHFDHLIVDDLVTRENSTTRDQMQKIKEFYKAIFPLRNDPLTPIDIVGTRWDDGDLYGDLEKDPDVEVIKFPSYTTLQSGEKIPLWPERYPINELMKIKSGPKMGSYLFSCLYQQDPIPQEDAVFKERYFQYFTVNPITRILTRDDSVSVPIGTCYMAVDGATEEGKNDYSAIIVGFRDSNDNNYILDTYIKQTDPADLLDIMKEVFLQWSCVKCAAQTAVVEKMLKSFLKKKQKDEKFYLPIEPLKKNTSLNKEFCIKQMQPWYEGKFVWHNEKLRGGILEEQLTRFPKAQHDDAPDAEQMLFEILLPSSKQIKTENYDRNSLQLWKNRLKRAMGNNPSESAYGIVTARTY
jgi:predicted phage terminase large subunit-like protein